MVMKGKAMRKNLRQSIVKSFGRYLASEKRHRFLGNEKRTP